MAKAILQESIDMNIQVISSPSDGTSPNENLKGYQLDPIKIYKSKNLLIRAFKELLLCKKIVAQIDFESAFQIYTVPSPFILLTNYLKRNNNYAIDVRDCSWDYIEQKGIYGLLASKILKLMIRPIFDKAKFVTCTNDFEALSILRNFNKVATIIPNGIEVHKYNKLTNIKTKSPDQSNITTVLYAGNIGYAQSLITLVKAAERLDKFKFEIVGAGSKKPEIAEYLLKNNVDNMNLTSAIGWNDLVDKYVDTDILYAQIINDFSSAIPSKIFEYIATGRKVVLGLPDGPAKSTFKDFSGVFFHDPEDTDGCMFALDLARRSGQPNKLLNNDLLKKYVRENFNKTFSGLVLNNNK